MGHFPRETPSAPEYAEVKLLTFVMDAHKGFTKKSDGFAA